MDNQTLLNMLSTQFNTTSQTYTLDPTGLSSPNITALVAQTLGIAPPAALAITQTSGPQAFGSGYRIAGVATAYNFSDVETQADFFLDGSGTPQLSLKLFLPTSGAAPWSFTTAYPQLANSIFAQVALETSPAPRFVFASSKYSDSELSVEFQQGLSFYGGVAPGGDGFGALASVLGSLATTTAAGPIVPPPPGPAINLDLDYNATLNKYFPGITLPLVISLVSEFDSTGTRARIGLDVSASFTLGNVEFTIGTLLSGNKVGVLELWGTFDNLALPGPSDIAKLVGAGDVVSNLPARYQAAGAVQITGLGIGIGVRTLKVTKAWIQLGALQGDGWEIVPGWLTLKNVGLLFVVAGPFESNRQVFATLSADLNVPSTSPILQMEVSATAPGYTFTASLVPDTTFNVTDLVARFLPAVSDAPALVLSNLGLMVQSTDSGVQYTFNAAIDVPWTLTLGGTSVISLEQASFYLDNFSNNGSMGGQFQGVIDILGVVTAFQYTIPGSFQINTVIPQFQVNTAQLVNGLADGSWTAPSWFPTFTFPETEIYIQRVQDGQDWVYTFVLRAQLTNLGTILFQAARIGGNWGFAAGIDMSGLKISSFPGLSSLQPFDDTFQLSELIFVFSSLTSTQFQFPNQSAFQTPDVGAKNLQLPSQAGGLQAGFNLYAQMTFDTTGHQGMIAKWFNLQGTLGITLNIGLDPVQNSRLFLSGDFLINTDTRFAWQFGGMIQGGEIGLFLTGLVSTTVQGQPLQFSVTAVFVENGALVAGTMQGTLDFNGVKLSNLALEIGVDLEGIPSVGIMASLDIQNLDASIAVFFDSTNPAQSMFAGAISDFTLNDVVTALAGNASVPSELQDGLSQVGIAGVAPFQIPATFASVLDNLQVSQVSAAFQQYGKVTIPTDNKNVLLVQGTEGQSWYLTDMSTMTHYELNTQGDQIVVKQEAQVYCVPSPSGTYIGGTGPGAFFFPQGFRVSGEISLFFIQASAIVNVSTNQGIAADINVAPIIIFNKEFVSITGYQGQGGPQLSLSTYAQSSPSLPAAFQQPHLFISADVQMLGITGAEIYLSVSKAGLHFNLDGQLVPGTTFALFGDFDSLTNFAAGGTATVSVNATLDFGELGKIYLNSGVTGTLSAGYQNQVAFAKMHVAFNFQGEDFSFDLTLSVTGDELAQLADLFINEIKSLISDFLKDVGNWLEWVKDGVVTGINTSMQALAQIMSDVYGLTVGQIAQLLKDTFGGHADINLHIDNVVQQHLDQPGTPHTDGHTGNHIDDNIKQWDGSTTHNDNTGSLPHNDIPAVPGINQATQHQDQPDHGDNS